MSEDNFNPPGNTSRPENGLPSSSPTASSPAQADLLRSLTPSPQTVEATNPSFAPTHKLIKAFLDNLPLPGQCNLADLITHECAYSGTDGLERLAAELLWEILVPIKAAHYHFMDPPAILRSGCDPEEYGPETLKKAYLLRDNYRCTWTGRPDKEAATVLTQLRLNSGSGAKCKGVLTKLTRILPLLMPPLIGNSAHGATGNGDREHMFDLLELCLPGIRGATSPEQADSPGNLMTMMGGMFLRMFKTFKMALVPTREHTYTLITYPSIDPLLFRGPEPLLPWAGADEITFGDLLKTGIPLPDPRRLAMHAAIAAIMYESGYDAQTDDMLHAYWFGKVELPLGGGRVEEFLDSCR